VPLGGCHQYEAHRVGAGQRPWRRRSTPPWNGSCCVSGTFATGEQTRRTVAAWIDEYNTQRRHSTNGMLSPVAYERAHAAQREPQAATGANQLRGEA
jgi:transposase InsO family protein